MKLKLTKYVNTQYVNIFKQKFIIFFSKIFETFWQFRFISLLCHSPCNSQANKSLKLKNQLTRPAGKNLYFVFSIVLINFCFVFNSLMKFVQILLEGAKKGVRIFTPLNWTPFLTPSQKSEDPHRCLWNVIPSYRDISIYWYILCSVYFSSKAIEIWPVSSENIWIRDA